MEEIMRHGERMRVLIKQVPASELEIHMVVALSENEWGHMRIQELLVDKDVVVAVGMAEQHGTVKVITKKWLPTDQMGVVRIQN